jgi:hypothetical protein
MWLHGQALGPLSARHQAARSQLLVLPVELPQLVLLDLMIPKLLEDRQASQKAVSQAVHPAS